MRKVIVLIFLYISAFFSFGCHGNNPTNSVPADPTQVFYVHGNLQQENNQVKIEIFVANNFCVPCGNATPIPNATVMIENILIRQSATPGAYTSTIFGELPAGSTLNLSVITASGEASGKIVVPVKPVISMPANNAEIKIGDIGMTSWTCASPGSYSYVQIDGVDIFCYMISQQSQNKTSTFYFDTFGMSEGSCLITAYNIDNENRINLGSEWCGWIDFINASDPITIFLKK